MDSFLKTHPKSCDFGYRISIGLVTENLDHLLRRQLWGGVCAGSFENVFPDQTADGFTAWPDGRRIVCSHRLHHLPHTIVRRQRRDLAGQLVGLGPSGGLGVGGVLPMADDTETKIVDRAVSTSSNAAFDFGQRFLRRCWFVFTGPGQNDLEPDPRQRAAARNGRCRTRICVQRHVSDQRAQTKTEIDRLVQTAFIGMAAEIGRALVGDLYAAVRMRTRFGSRVGDGQTIDRSRSSVGFMERSSDLVFGDSFSVVVGNDSVQRRLQTGQTREEDCLVGDRQFFVSVG